MKTDVNGQFVGRWRSWLARRAESINRRRHMRRTRLTGWSLWRSPEA